MSSFASLGWIELNKRAVGTFRGSLHEINPHDLNVNEMSLRLTLCRPLTPLSTPEAPLR